MEQKSIQKKTKKRKYEKQFEDIVNFPTEEEIYKIDDSETSKQALRYLNIHTTNAFTKLNRSHFTRIRDYILTNLILNNASRPAAIRNMTLREFNSAKKQGENFVVPVVSHKTGHIAPSMIVFNNALHRSTVDYIEIVRKKISYVDERDETLVFVTYGGTKIRSSPARSQLCSFCNQSQESKGRTINSTAIRKFTTTKVHS